MDCNTRREQWLEKITYKGIKMKLTPAENYLEAIRFGSPEYMPRGNEDIFHRIQLKGHFNYANWTDPWGVRWVMDMPGTSPFPKGNPLPDIRKLEDYKLPDPDTIFQDMEEEKRKIKEAKAQGKLIDGGYSYFIFERVWALMGLENFLAALIEEPELTHELLHKIAVFAKRVFANMLELGADMISFSEDLGTQRALMFSPKHFEEFFLPEYRFAFEDVLKEGKMINFHSCGCVESIVQGLADIRVSVLNPVQARANDLAGIKKVTLGKTALCGAVDSHLLLVGSIREVRDETARVIEILKPGGGYICAPDQGFPEFPQENIDAMYETAVEMGLY